MNVKERIKSLLSVEPRSLEKMSRLLKQSIASRSAFVLEVQVLINDIEQWPKRKVWELQFGLKESLPIFIQAYLIVMELVLFFVALPIFHVFNLVFAAIILAGLIVSTRAVIEAVRVKDKIRYLELAQKCLDTMSGVSKAQS